jgi:hypothetical protein
MDSLWGCSKPRSSKKAGHRVSMTGLREDQAAMVIQFGQRYDGGAASERDRQPRSRINAHPARSTEGTSPGGSIDDDRPETGSGMRGLELEVQKTVLVVKRCIALIEKARRNCETMARDLKGNGGSPQPRRIAVRGAVDRCRPVIREAELAGWRVLEETLIRLESREIAIRARGAHQPVRQTEWELARARAPFVKEDCELWARTCPEQIVEQYEWAVEDGDMIYAYLLERYGPPALESAGEWDNLTRLRTSLAASPRSSQDELAEIERLYGLLRPLMIQLSELKVPDAFILVHQDVCAVEGASIDLRLRHPGEVPIGTLDFSS